MKGGRVRYFACMLLIFVFLAGSLFAFGAFDSTPYLTPTDAPSNSAHVSWNTEGHAVDTGVYYLIFIVDGPIISKKVVRIAK